MKRKIIEIDENKCNGCGLCVPNCAEGALQIIDGKARLISDLFCDGLGACIGHCPQDAIKVIEREAEDYNERRVMEENIIKGGINTIKAHLKHLLDHNETGYYAEALKVLEEKGININLNLDEKDVNKTNINIEHRGCPGSRSINFEEKLSSGGLRKINKIESMLTQWPIQLHLISPNASYFKNADLLVASDCSAFAYGAFHNDFLKGKKIVIGCPKLDNALENYVEKIRILIDEAKINTITVVIMEVPCCGGLLGVVMKALNLAKRKIPVKKIIISIQGEILENEWV